MHCSPLIGPPSAHWTTCTAAFRPPGRDAIPGRKHAASRRRIRRVPTLARGRNALILNGLGLPASSAPWVAAGVAVRVFSSLNEIDGGDYNCGRSLSSRESVPAGNWEG